MQQDIEIEGNRPVLDIIEIVLDTAVQLLDRVGLTPPAIDLGPAGDAGLHPVAGEIAFNRVRIKVLLGLGMRRAAAARPAKARP